MKILLISASLPYPPQQGGALRTFGLLKGLHEAGHEVALLSFYDHENNLQVENTPLSEFTVSINTVRTPSRSNWQRLRDLVLTSEPDIAGRHFTSKMLDVIKDSLANQRYDLIQFEGIEVACFLPLVRDLSHLKAKLCYNAFNAEAALQQVIFEVDRQDIRRWLSAAYSYVQSRRIAHFERELCTKSDLVLAVSKEDSQILQRYHPEHDVPVIANGVFASDYGNAGEAMDLGDAALVFTGKMDYRPNVDAAIWFANEVLPRIQEQVPEAKFYIVGQRPHSKLDSLRDKPGVAITGWVNDVQPFLRGTRVYVAPLRMGSGTRLKILEAMASGCAVVATTLAASGIGAGSGHGLLLADTSLQMAQSIVTLLGNPEQRKRMGNEAQLYVRENYDWSVIIPRLLDAYRSIGLG